MGSLGMSVCVARARASAQSMQLVWCCVVIRARRGLRLQGLR